MAQRADSGRGRAWSDGLVVVALLLLSGCDGGGADEAPAPTIVEAARQYLEIIVEAAGELEPLRTVEVMSKASGQVVQVSVDTGDEVQTGSLLARIDPRDVQNDFNQAEADYEVASERLTIAEAQLRRSESLLEAGVITEQEHEGRDLEFANSRAALVRAETNLGLARLRLADVTIGSPMDGTVLQKNVEEGQVISSPSGNVSGGTVLLTIADLRVMQVRTLVSEADVGRITSGMQATVSVDAFQDRSFSGVVEKIEPQAVIEQSVVNFPVIVRLDNSERILKPGMSANVSILLAERPDAITLPNNAIVEFEQMAAAAAVIGVPDERLDLDPSAFQELRRQLAGTGGGRQGLGAREGERTVGEGEIVGGDETDGGDSVVDAGVGAERFRGLRGRMGQGDLSPEEIQAMIQTRGERPPFGRGPRTGGSPAASGRPGIVFVESEEGVLLPRAVLIGITDWSNSEIVSGLAEGERVALIAVAGLLEETNTNRGFRFRGGRMGLPF